MTAMQTAYRPRGLHSRIVRLATLILPVAALVLLSTLFLVARRVNPEDAIPFAEVDVSERARDQQLTAPRFTGLSQDGTAYDFVADRALPDPVDPRRMSAMTVRLDLADPAGGRSTVVADTAEVDTGARTLAVEGDVRVDTSAGYSLRAGRLQGSLDRLDILGDGPITGEGPLGTIRAGGLRIDEDEGGAARLVFTGGVDLLYVPPK
ncbi:LPS export ABC transporter periplasmic protein LptC [Jannaschia rubra]|uniref:Lipopolysaccharide-assembly, LptC-related n=1 Tax=Jannaschia rubra TaxID=282197 RepID=A0A0M6XRG0_9RHOB|nr:LPS export ABC transporter periplasmic protein LptC [Jannaschia rubra]CTQ32751.1 Lipopolysaccharide-assembly, LptC-related [Jannaschia rubra]SFF88839.1 lipopolysaccharide export system protein LptC [Jannaschia rubra]